MKFTCPAHSIHTEFGYYCIGELVCIFSLSIQLPFKAVNGEKEDITPYTSRFVSDAFMHPKCVNEQFSIGWTCRRCDKMDGEIMFHKLISLVVYALSYA